MIERCAKAGPEQMRPARIALRLLALVTMSVMGMVWVLSHCIQDLYRSPSKNEFLAGLQEEIMKMTERSEFSKATNRLGSKDTIDSLHRLDSTLRESMRLSAISIVSVARDVVGQELDLGLDGGLKIPQGVRVVFPSQPMHMDPSFAFHDKPREFDAFRFSRRFEADSSQTRKAQGSSAEEEARLERAAASSTVPSQSFLPWGYGKHACTARWYAAQTLKQALAYIILNYDVEVLGDCPKSMSLVNVMVPHTNVQIRIRRKTS
jgi:cytochrome P450